MIYIIYPFHALQISGRLGSTLCHTFPTLWTPTWTELQFPINFFKLICSQPRDKQNRARDFLPLKYCLNNLFSTIFMQNTFSKLFELLKQKMNNLLLVKARTPFCAAVSRKWVCKSWSFQRVCTAARPVFTTQKPLPTKIPLTKETITSSSL